MKPIPMSTEQYSYGLDDTNTISNSTMAIIRDDILK